MHRCHTLQINQNGCQWAKIGIFWQKLHENYTKFPKNADIRFGQFEVYGTCDYVVQSHVTSFGVGFHELLVSWRFPYPYIELAVWAFLGNLGEFCVIFAKKYLSRPTDIRFG